MDMDDARQLDVQLRLKDPRDPEDPKAKWRSMLHQQVWWEISECRDIQQQGVVGMVQRSFKAKGT